MTLRWTGPLLAVSLALSASAATIDTIAGDGRAGRVGDHGPAVDSQLNQPFFCALDRQGNLFVADLGNECVRRIDAETGAITTVAGNGQTGYSGDGGPAVDATFNQPCALAVDDGGHLFVVDRLNAVIRRVDRQGVITTVAGTGEKKYSGDGGPGQSAALREPHDCCLDGRGGLLIADVADWRIRRLDLNTGEISTFAGTGRPRMRPKRADLGDGGLATEAVILGARAVCVDVQGNTYICEREGNSLRKVDLHGVISTVAGTGDAGYSGDGGPATEATFRGPKGLCADAAGNIYVVDTENHAIRRIDAASGAITTFVGGRAGPGGDGGAADQAGLFRPHGCLMAPDGALLIADTENHRIRRVAVD